MQKSANVMFEVYYNTKFMFLLYEREKINKLFQLIFVFVFIFISQEKIDEGRDIVSQLLKNYYVFT